MKNFKVTSLEDGKEYWISRSIAVVGFVFTRDDDGHICVLANKRGPGTPDFQGYWNCPCGYLDYNETAEEAVIREVFEETGYDLSCVKINMIGVDSNPSSNKQNVTIKFKCLLSNRVLGKREGGELDEVSEIKWIKLSELKQYRWAFDHDIIIQDIISTNLPFLF